MAVAEDGGAARGAQRDVEDGAVFAGVDSLAGEHGIAACGDVALPGEGEEEGDGFAGDAVLGVVEEEAGGFGGEAVPAGGIGGEEIAQRCIGDAGVVGAQRGPGRRFGGAHR